MDGIYTVCNTLGVISSFFPLSQPVSQILLIAGYVWNYIDSAGGFVFALD